jgi:hypothetical protein
MSIEENLKQVCSRISACLEHAGRSPDSLHWLAVTKGRSIEQIRELTCLGVWDLGENYLQEALEKISVLKASPIKWHFIGGIQSNKTRDIAENFCFVHALDRARIAERLSEQRPRDLGPLSVCIHVNWEGEASKGGVLPGDLLPLAERLLNLPGLRWRGLMALPPVCHDAEQQLARFQHYACEWQALRDKGFVLDVLSMGMSDDFELAIQAGSTFLRLGRILF